MFGREGLSYNFHVHGTHMKETYTSADDIGMFTCPMGTKLEGGLKASGSHDVSKWHVHRWEGLKPQFPCAWYAHEGKICIGR